MKTPDRTWGRYVVVSGPAASGKTMLAQAISAELGWPLISKDEIKKALVGVFPPKTTDDAASLGRTAMAVLLRIAAKTTSGAVLDAVWREGQGRLELRDLPGEMVELFCQCPPAVVKERYEARTRPAQYISEHATTESLWSTERLLRCPVGGMSSRLTQPPTLMWWPSQTESAMHSDANPSEGPVDRPVASIDRAAQQYRAFRYLWGASVQ